VINVLSRLLIWSMGRSAQVVAGAAEPVAKVAA